MPIRTFPELLEAAQAKGPKTIAVAAAHQSEVMLAGLDAEVAGLAEVILVGDGDQIRQIASDEDFDISRMEVIHAPQPHEAAWTVMKLVSDGQAEIAMKGRVETSDFLRAALSRELGLRTGRLFSHVAAFEIPGFDRLIFISDAGVIVANYVVHGGDHDIPHPVRRLSSLMGNNCADIDAVDEIRRFFEPTSLRPQGGEPSHP